MSIAPVEPHIELRFHPTDLRPGDIPRAGAYLGSPSEAMQAAFVVARTAMVDEMRTQIQGLENPTHAQILRMADLAWQAVAWKYRKISAPVMADAYVHAYRAAEAGDVPMSIIYDLAERHAEKIGDYFHTTSRDALGEGFTTLVNRQVPAKAAADRVLMAYGLSPRQMRGYTGSAFENKVTSAIPQAFKARARAYIGRAFTGRMKKLSDQEEHNIDEQAKQLSWMWLQSKGRLNDKAQKMWITAHDERVCPVCGPLHGKKVLVGEQFKTHQGDFWSPGLHPNCRCVVRLIENRFSKDLAGTALADFNELHPRGDAGRFGVKARTKPQPKPRVKTIDVDEEFRRIINQPAPVRHITYAPAATQVQPAEPKQQTQTDTEFASLIAAQPEHTDWGPAYKHKPAPTEAPTTTAVEPDLNFKIRTATELKLDFAVDLVMDTRDAVEADVLREAKAKTEPQLRMKPPTTKLNRPVYRMFDYDELAQGRIDNIHLDLGKEFTTDDIDEAQEIAERQSKLVDDTNDRVIKMSKEFEDEDAEGKPIFGKWNEDDLRAMVEWRAHTAGMHRLQEHDPNFPGATRATLNWEYEDGRTYVPERYTFEEMADMFNVDRHDFEVFLVRLDEVHDASLSKYKTEDVSGGANSKERSFATEGPYRLVEGSQEYTGADGTAFGAIGFKIEPAGIHEEPESE